MENAENKQDPKNTLDEDSNDSSTGLAQDDSTETEPGSPESPEELEEGPEEQPEDPDELTEEEPDASDPEEDSASAPTAAATADPEETEQLEKKETEEAETTEETEETEEEEEEEVEEPTEETASDSGDDSGDSGGKQTRDITIGDADADVLPETGTEEDDKYGWYILQVRGGREEKIKEQLQQKLLSEGLFDLINEISVPKEKVSKIKGGERTVHEKKLFPGYVLVNMDLDEHARYIIKNVRGVYQFLGEEEPRKLSREEVEKMLAPTKEEEEKPKVEIEFEVGDTVRIKEGPFENMEGNVEELLPEKGLVRLTVTIFGRATPVELEYWQLESI